MLISRWRASLRDPLCNLVIVSAPLCWSTLVYRGTQRGFFGARVLAAKTNPQTPAACALVGLSVAITMDPFVRREEQKRRPDDTRHRSGRLDKRGTSVLATEFPPQSGHWGISQVARRARPPVLGNWYQSVGDRPLRSSWTGCPRRRPVRHPTGRHAGHYRCGRNFLSI